MLYVALSPGSLVISYPSCKHLNLTLNTTSHAGPATFNSLPRLKKHLFSLIANAMMDDRTVGRGALVEMSCAVFFCCVHSIYKTSCCDSDSGQSVFMWCSWRFSGEHSLLTRSSRLYLLCHVLKVFGAFALNMKTFGSDYANRSLSIFKCVLPMGNSMFFLHYSNIRLRMMWLGVCWCLCNHMCAFSIRRMCSLSWIPGSETQLAAQHTVGVLEQIWPIPFRS